MEYEGLNLPLLGEIARPPRKVLDLGCGVGSLGRALKEKWACEVTGVTYSENEARRARQHLNRVVVADLNEWQPDPSERFDLVICSHVLEHLYQPEALLKRLHPALAEDGTLTVALPNLLFWKERLRLLRGHFRYTEGGIMDATHFRFFDFVTAQELIRTGGYQIARAHADGAVPLGPLRRLLPSSWKQRLDRWGLRLFPGLFGWQILIQASLAS